MNEKQLIEKYAEAWQNLDADVIIPYLADSFSYSSMWVCETLDKTGYTNYIKGKFETLKHNNCAPSVKIGTNEIGKPAVVLKQGCTDPVFITIEVEEEKIVSAYMCAF